MKIGLGLSKTLFYLAGILVVVLFVIINLDVVGRNLFGKPIAGTTELISLILPACVFLALPHIFSKGLLIATDLFSSSIGRKMRGYKSFVAISLLLTTLFWCVAMLMGTIPLFFRAVQNDEFTGVWGDFIAPVWPSKLAIVGGCSVLFFLVLRQLYLRYRDSTRVFRDSFCAILLFTILVGGLSICDTNSALGVGSISMLLILIALGLPVAFALMMSALAGIFFMKENFYVAVDTLGMVAGSSVSSYVFSAVPMFVLLGLVVSEADIGRDSLRVVRRMTNALSGGLAVATIIANALFAAITGISIASAAIFSKIAYPSLIDEGYTPRFSVGLIAGSSVLGMLIPPSILLIIYGIIAEVSINRLFIAAVLPGLILITFLVTMVVVLSYFGISKINKNRKRDDPEKLNIQTLNGFFSVLLILIAVLGGIYSGLFSPTEAGSVGAAMAIFLSVLIRRFGIKAIKQMVFDATETSSSILFLIVAASMFGMMLTLSGIPNLIGEIVATSQLELAEFAVIYLIVLIVLGMLIDSTSILLIMVPFALPTIVNLDGDLVWFGIVSLLGVEIGLLTPPLGISVFTIKASLKDDRLSVTDIFFGAAPFAMLIFFLALLIIFYPGLCGVL